MTITLEIREDLAARLGDQPLDLLRQAPGLTSLKEGIWTEAQLGRFLALPRVELDQFLKDHGIELPYTMADLERERTLRE